ncbi:hypothetical protein [Microbacterium sp. 77mftsu3.1]|uniref:hypothetical protein n=1 Tax=Microbacterium sp. 77mftsu3.1 TaxID=1761802 RepID=UPI000370DC5F|nr:hypothetical protein [Microbacterium sp. 77mftsu3.1]SDH49633.1 hypothetical protein SAMN04488590_3444 [Microbacterium sp. 77mftsu3.1]
MHLSKHLPSAAPGAVAAREEAREQTGRFGVQKHSTPEVALPANSDVATWGTWDPDEGFYSIDISEVGLRHLSRQRTFTVTRAVDRWMAGDREFPSATSVPIGQVTTTMQPILRRDALLWYTEQLRAEKDTFDDVVSFYGADGPLGVRWPDGTITLLDGNHRFAAAVVRGDEAFTMQVIDL